MAEIPLFFPRGSSRLFGLLHESTDSAARLGFVFSHPFAEEKLWSHRVLVSLARALATKGHPVLRFDYLGAGDSDGRTSDTSLETHLADLAAAVDTLAARQPLLERIGLIGLRLGASLVARLAERVGDGQGATLVRGAPLVLWDPVLDGAAYMQEVFRANLSAQLAAHGRVIETRESMSRSILEGGVVNVDGYEIGRTLFESIGVHDLVPATRKLHQGPVLVVPILPPGKPAKPQSALEALAASYAQGTLRPVEEFQFWREIKQFYGRAERLQSTTLAWLGEIDG